MQLFKSIIFAAVTAFSVNAAAISLGPLDGKMKNLTSFKNTDFEVRILFQCDSPGQEFKYDLQTVVQTGSVKDDGTFTVPELKLPEVNIPSYLGCHLDVHYKLRDELEKKYPGQSNLRVMLSGRDIYDGKPELIFTAFELEENPMNYKVSTGISNDEFIQGDGKNFYVALTYDFSAQFSLSNKDFQKQHFYRWGNYFHNSIGVTSKGIIYLPGLREAKTIRADVKINVTSDLAYSGAEMSTTTYLDKPLPSGLLTIDIDYEKIFRKLTTITGTFKDTSIFLNLANSSQKRTYQGYYDAEVSLECKEGVLTGELKPGAPSYKDESDSSKIVNQPYAINGTCDGKESGHGELKLQFLDNSTKKVTFSFNRIASCFMAVFGCLMSSESPEPDHYNHPGAEYSSSLELKDSDNKSIGIIQIGAGS